MTELSKELGERLAAMTRQAIDAKFAERKDEMADLRERLARIEGAMGIPENKAPTKLQRVK